MSAGPAPWWVSAVTPEVLTAGFADEGPARVGGASPKRFVRSRLTGRRYLFKAEDQLGRPQPYRAHADALAASLAAALFDPGEFIPVGLTTLDYDSRGPVLGSVQPFLDGAVSRDYRLGFLDAMDVGGRWFDGPDLPRLQREQVLDWLIANHDAHGNQWVRVDGVLLGIDKTQAGKHLGDDRLDPDYHPNAGYGEDAPVYHYLFHAVRTGRRSVDPEAIRPVLDRADALGDDAFLSHYAGYLGVIEPARAARLTAVLRERKRSLRADFGRYYTAMLGRGPAGPRT
jgi:hypothetical protein